MILQEFKKCIIIDLVCEIIEKELFRLKWRERYSWIGMEL